MRINRNDPNLGRELTLKEPKMGALIGVRPNWGSKMEG
jgi:hypothetical protein